MHVTLRRPAVGKEGEAGGVLNILHSRSRMTGKPRILTMLGRNTPGFRKCITVTGTTIAWNGRLES